MPTTQARRVRSLTAKQLGVDVAIGDPTHASNRPDDPDNSEFEQLAQQVKSLLEWYGGVIFTGPPGTGKTYAANAVAHLLTGNDPQYVTFLQFHTSFQYEDFMEGFVPNEEASGFTLKPKHFLEICDRATSDPEHQYVLVIDELSRSDPSRVFGEALTYVERTKRNLPFSLASGRACRVPQNLAILATMNPFDRGVDDVDAAFERRFAKIGMDPDLEALRIILSRNGAPTDFVIAVVEFFKFVNNQAVDNPQATLGHTFFHSVTDVASLHRLWDHQLKFWVDRAFRLDVIKHGVITGKWGELTARLQPIEILDSVGPNTEQNPEESVHEMSMNGPTGPAPAQAS